MEKTAEQDSNDLTQGNVTRQLITYATPLVLSSILQALYSMADIIIVGHFVGSSGISAINNATQIMFMITNIAIGLTTGGNILIGQYFGAKDANNQKQAAGTLFSMSLILGLCIAVPLYFFTTPLLTALGAPSLEEAAAYMHICALGVFPILGYNAISAVLRAVGDSKRPFRFIAIATSLNVGLDLIFVGPLGLNTAGAAIATVISQATAFLLCFHYALGRPKIMEFHKDSLRIRKSHLSTILRLGVPSMIQMTVGGISWLTVTFLINTYGVTVSAGNGISIKIKDFFLLFITSMAGAAASMIAQNLGARRFDRAKHVTYAAMKITVGISVVLIVVVELLAPTLAGLFTSDPAVIAVAAVNLRIEIISQLFYAVFFIYHALAIGAGHSIFAMFSSFVNCILVRAVLAVAFNHYFGLTGLYVACMVAPSISILLGWLYMRSNVWKRSLIQTA
jgi:putative MATE family efflux protein